MSRQKKSRDRKAELARKGYKALHFQTDAEFVDNFKKEAERCGLTQTEYLRSLYDRYRPHELPGMDFIRVMDLLRDNLTELQYINMFIRENGTEPPPDLSECKRVLYNATDLMLREVRK